MTDSNAGWTKHHQGAYMPDLTTSFTLTRAMNFHIWTDTGRSYVKKSSDGKTIFWYKNPAIQSGNQGYNEDYVMNEFDITYFFMGLA